MRIISPFKDYYDSIQEFGTDPHVTYHRKPATHTLQILQYIELPDLSIIWDVFVDNNITLLFFCGKLYPYVNWNRDFTIEELTSKTSDIYHAAHTIASQNYPMSSIKSMLCLVGYPIGYQIHSALGSPVLACQFDYQTEPNYNDTLSIIINPRLANFGFQSILDPSTCFQEIAQYLGNELAQTDIAPLRTGDDETILRAKGFDEQSFRTAAPGDKKLNRRANRHRKKVARINKEPQ